MRDLLSSYARDPDAEAMRPQDRGAILFDLGIGKSQSDICVRTADPTTIELLREA